jgi:hypothetical protein
MEITCQRIKALVARLGPNLNTNLRWELRHEGSAC